MFISLFFLLFVLKANNQRYPPSGLADISRYKRIKVSSPRRKENISETEKLKRTRLDDFGTYELFQQKSLR